MIIGVTGYAQSGKDTVAQFLIDHHGFERVAFADPIREMLYEMDPVIPSNEDVYSLRVLVDSLGWEAAKREPEVRRLLQELGVSARLIVDENIWITVAAKKMYDPEKNYVITDVRFENEAAAVKIMGGQLWRIKRSGVGPVNEHISEMELDAIKVDQILLNNGSLEDLQELITTRMGVAV